MPAISSITWRVAAWLVLMVLPVQGLVAATGPLRGPAHFHLAQTAPDGPQATHVHEDVAHHHHDVGEGAITVDDGHHHHDDVALEDAAAAGAHGGVDVLLSTSATMRIDMVRPGVTRWNASKPIPRFTGRLERPPNP